MRGDRLDGARHGDATLELHASAPASFTSRMALSTALLRARLVGAERQVADHQRAPPPAGDHAGVVDHLVERHRQRGVVALHHHAERVADQETVDPRLVEQAGEGPVVRGHHRDPLARRPSCAPAREPSPSSHPSRNSLPRTDGPGGRDDASKGRPAADRPYPALSRSGRPVVGSGSCCVRALVSPAYRSSRRPAVPSRSVQSPPLEGRGLTLIQAECSAGPPVACPGSRGSGRPDRRRARRSRSPSS